MIGAFLKPAVISAPFGIYARAPGVTRIRGSYTLQPRPGRFTQAFKTLRTVEGGWINQMGLRNPGIARGMFWHGRNSVFSIAAVEKNDWYNMYTYLKQYPQLHLEINRGCPNETCIPLTNNDIHLYSLHFKDIIMKLPPDMNEALKMAAQAMEFGIRIFHACNTLPTENGGISGYTLKPYSLRITEQLKRRYDCRVIGGGGIYTPADVRKYHDAGADHFALGTIWLTPWKVPAVLKEIKKVVDS